MSAVDRPAAGIWHELTFGVGLRRMVVALVIALVGPALITLILARFMLPVGLYILAIVPAAFLGRLWPGLLAAAWSWLGLVYVVQSDVGVVPEPYDWVMLILLVAVGALIAVEEAARARATAMQERLAFLAQANRTLTTSLDYERTIAELTRLVVPRLADWCAVHLRTEAEAELAFHVAHQDSAKVELAKELWERYPPNLTDPAQPLAQVLGSGRPLVFRRVTEDLLRQTARDEQHLRILGQLGLRSGIIVPLVGRQRVLGALTLVMAESGRRYSEADLGFAEELARTAAMAIENARLHQSQSRIAQTLQNSLLPTEIPEIPGVEVAVRYRPAGEGTLVGGDFYDVFEASKGAWAVALGDVSGKGPEAAALTGLVRYTIRAAVVREAKPSSVLAAVNRQILRNNSARFCTAAVGRVERSNGRLSVLVSCGGHPPPLVYRRDHAVETMECIGTLLGVFPDPSLVDTPVELDPGDAVVFYTDGVIERFERAGRGGDAQLVALLWESEGLDAARIADRIYEEAGMAGEDRPRDDMAIVVLRVRSDAG